MVAGTMIPAMIRIRTATAAMIDAASAIVRMKSVVPWSVSANGTKMSAVGWRMSAGANRNRTDARRLHHLRVRHLSDARRDFHQVSRSVHLRSDGMGARISDFPADLDVCGDNH